MNKLLNGNFRSKLSAIRYLIKVNSDYRIIVRTPTLRILYHFGDYGWSSGGSFKEWKEIAMVDYKNQIVLDF